MSLQTYSGSCHCGAVRFEADLDLGKPASRCNCSLCTKRGASTQIVKPAALRVTAKEGALGEYAWASKTNQFYFCKACGMHVFGRGNLPELGGAYAAVNVNCIDDVDPETLSYIYWDGRHDNWHAGPRESAWPVKE